MQVSKFEAGSICMVRTWQSAGSEKRLNRPSSPLSPIMATGSTICHHYTKIEEY